MAFEVVLVTVSVARAFPRANVGSSSPESVPHTVSGSSTGPVRLPSISKLSSALGTAFLLLPSSLGRLGAVDSDACQAWYDRYDSVSHLVR